MFTSDKADLIEYFRSKEEAPHLKPIRLGEFMVERGLISGEQLYRALRYQDENPGIRLGEVLGAMGVVSSPTFHKTLSEYQSVAVVDVMA